MQSKEEKRQHHTEYMRIWRTRNNEKNRAYYREYNQKNNSHISELRKASWQKKKDRINAERRSKHAKNPEVQRAYDRVRWNLDKEKILAKNRRSYHRHIAERRRVAEKYRREHPDVIRAWRKRNLDHLIEYNRSTRFPCAPYQFARKNECVLCSMTNQESLRKYGRRLDVHHIDHNLLNNSPENLLTSCRKCHKQLDKIMIPVVE